jgi:hypothetical protein
MVRIKPLKLFVAANLLLLLFLGLRIVFKFPIWSPIDEGAHFNYVQFVSENKRLPILSKDMASWQVLSIAEGIYPQKTTTDPATIGLGGYLYEAFQPPLYYLVSIPAFILGGSDFYHKIFTLRVQDLAILLASLVLCWKLATQLFTDERKKKIFRIASILFLMMPGILLRSITISNAVLELALAAVFFYLLIVREDMVWSAVTLGLLLLSRFTSIFLYGAFGLVLAAKLLAKTAIEKGIRPKSVLRLLLPAAIPLLILAPWFAFNCSHYGSLTANELSKAMQNGIVNPDSTNYTLKDLIPMSNTMMDTFILPEEWGIHGHVFIQWGAWFFKVLLVFLVLPVSMVVVLAKLIRERKQALLKIWENNKRPIVCVTWILLNIIMLFAIILREDWPVRLGRYIYASILPLIYLTTEAIDFLFREKGQLLLLLLSEALVLIMWGGIYLGF